MQHQLKRVVISTYKHNRNPISKSLLSSVTSNFDELIQQIESAPDVETLKTLLATALEYDSLAIHATAFESAHLASWNLKSSSESSRLLLDMEKRGLLPSARAFSYTASTLASQNEWKEAAKVVRKAWELDINVDPKTIKSVLIACDNSSLEDGAAERVQICYDFIDKTPPELRVNSMIRAAMNCIHQAGDDSYTGHDFLKKLISEHSEKEDFKLITSAYTTLMICYAQKEPHKVLELFQEAATNGHKLNVWSFDVAMKASIHLRKPDLALKLFLQLDTYDIEPIPMIARRALQAAELLRTSEFNEMLLPLIMDRSRPDLTLSSLTILAKLYAVNNQDEECGIFLDNFILANLPETNIEVSPEFQWCDEEWAKDRAPLICDHALSVLTAMKDLDRSLWLVRTVDVATIHPKIADKLSQLWSHMDADTNLHIISECLEAGLQPTPRSHSYAIAACRKEERWQDILDLYENVKHSRMSNIAFNTVIDACGRLGRFNDALELLYQARRNGVQPDVRTYNGVLSACAKSGAWSEARDTLKALKASDVKPDAHSFIHTMQACRKADRYTATMEVLADMSKAGITPSVVAYNTALGVASSRGLSIKAGEIMDNMAASKVRPNIITYNTAIRAFAKGKDLNRALDTALSMPKNKVPIQGRTLEALFLAFYNSESLPNSVGLMEHWLNKIMMKDSNDGKVIDSKISTVSAWMDNKKWLQLLSLVDRMVESDEEKGEEIPSIFAFGAIIRACEKIEWLSTKGLGRGEFQGGRTARLLVELMQQLPQLDYQPGRIILGLCFDACMKQVLNDEAQKKNLDSRDEILEFAFKTLEEIKKLPDFDPIAVQKQLEAAVAAGLTEMTPALEEMNHLISNDFTK